METRERCKVRRQTGRVLSVRTDRDGGSVRVGEHDGGRERKHLPCLPKCRRECRDTPRLREKSVPP